MRSQRQLQGNLNRPAFGDEFAPKPQFGEQVRLWLMLT